jgi:protein involved in polysaccharide export with SLBB domain
VIKAIGIATALMMSIFATSLSVAAATTSSEPAASAVAPDYVLGPGDRLRLSLYDDATFSGEFTVSDNGTVSLPLIGTQPAAGMTLTAFRDAIQAKLADGYYRNPRVSAEIANFRPFYILGEVNKPGQYPYVAGMTLGEAVAIANGYTYAARKGLVAIRRAKSSEEVKMQANPAMPIGPGDTVRVLERLF